MSAHVTNIGLDIAPMRKRVSTYIFVQYWPNDVCYCSLILIRAILVDAIPVHVGCFLHSVRTRLPDFCQLTSAMDLDRQLMQNTSD